MPTSISSVKKVLIVDDEPDLREILAYSFTEWGWKVSEASSGNEATERLSAEGFDLIVSDIRMPGGSGVDLTIAVRTKLLLTTPIILVSGFSDIDIVKAKALGAQHLMSKPFDLDELFNIAHGKF